MVKKNNLFIPRFLAFILDIFIVSTIVSFVSMPFVDYESINNLSDSASQIMIDYAEDEIDLDTYISSATSILYRLARKQGILFLATLFFSIMYFVVYQFYNKGQTLGKKLFKIKVVSNDFKELTMDNYIYRSFIINSLLIDIIIFSLMIFASETIWLIGVGMLEAINYILLFICGFMVIFNKDGRGLHDLLGNTKVIQCRK